MKGDARRHGWLLPQSGLGWSGIIRDCIHSFPMGSSSVCFQDARLAPHANHCWGAASAKDWTKKLWKCLLMLSIHISLPFVRTTVAKGLYVQMWFGDDTCCSCCKKNLQTLAMFYKCWIEESMTDDCAYIYTPRFISVHCRNCENFFHYVL